MGTQQAEEPRSEVDGERQDTLTVMDNRTGRSYELPIADGTIRAMDLRQIKVGDDDFGLMTYDPAFMNTASCRSTITDLDGERASCATGAIRSSSWPSTARSSRWPICWCTGAADP